MRQRVLIRHSKGSKAPAVQEFVMDQGDELTVGREPKCEVYFEREEFVSRVHMKLAANGAGPVGFTIVDLAARNGSFVNGRRVQGSTPLRSGDVVQVGEGGPEFVFDVAPMERPQPVEVATPPAVEPVYAPATPAAGAAMPEPLPQQKPAPPQAPQRPRGRPPRKRKPAVVVLIALAAVGLVLAAIAAGVYIAVRPPTPFVARTMDLARSGLTRVRNLFGRGITKNSGEIAGPAAESIVTVENAWQLVDGAGRQVKQIYMANRREPSGGNSSPLIPGAGPNLPVFVLLAGNRLQPLLTVTENPRYPSIGGVNRKPGFIVGPDGVLLTTRSATAPWNGQYDWRAVDTAGIVVVFDSQMKIASTAMIARRQFPQWRPADSGLVLENDLNDRTVRVNRSTVTPKFESLHVNSQARGPQGPAWVIKESAETGLATVRAAVLTGLPSVQIGDPGGLKPGDRLLLFDAASARTSPATLSAEVAGGAYSISPGAGAGTPGVPVFDTRGRVVAVEIESDLSRPGQMIAIPIRRALESLGQPVTGR